MLTSYYIINRCGLALFLFLPRFLSFTNQNSPSTHLNITTQLATSGTQVRLILTFSSNGNDTFLFDKSMFSVFNRNFEPASHLKKGKDGATIYKKINTSQCIIENKDGVQRFFSDLRLFAGEVIQYKSVFQVDRSYDSVYLTPDNKVTLTTHFIDVNRLRNSPKDSVIRIVYIFRPNDAQKKIGLKPKEITSNWFSIVKIQ
jgi:hypothetical protein